MKLATLDDGSRDGQLAVVARDLKSAHLADGIAPTLRAALDDWDFIAPQLAALSQALNNGRAQRSFEFDPARCMAPLPRAPQRVAARAYVHALERSLRARQAPVPDWLRDEAILCQGSAAMLGPQAAMAFAHEEYGIDFSAEIAVVCGDLPVGCTVDEADRQIRLLMLLNDVGLRNLQGPERDKGGGLLQSQPGAACSPVAVTPDELGDAWQGGKLHLAVRCSWNDKLVGQAQAGLDMHFHFPRLLAQMCKTRLAPAGTILSGGAVSNQDGKRGFSSIAEQRELELASTGAASTAYLGFGDTIKIDLFDSNGKSVFGAIEQTVTQFIPGKAR